MILLTAIANLITISELFHYFGTIKVVPAYQSVMIATGLLSGGIILNEFETYTNESLMLILLGTSICVMGLYFRLIFFANNEDILATP